MSRYAIPSLVLAMMLSACSSPEPDEQAAAVAQSQAAADAAATPSDPSAIAPVIEGNCDETQAQWVVGKPMDEAQLEQARKDANADSIRSLKPDQPATMDFNPNRLNVDLDEQGNGIAARCG